MKIINKANDGFNIFLFRTGDGFFVGCRLYDKDICKNCTLTEAIQFEEQLEELMDRLISLPSTDEFIPFYSSLVAVSYTHLPKTKEWNGFKRRYQEQLNELYTQAYDFKGFLLPPENDGINPFEGGFPLHPITLYALDRLSKKVAQNERTFFTYLASDEDHSLFSQLEKLDLKEFHFIGLDAIYDYFEENICSYRSGEAREVYKKYQVAMNKLGSNTEKSLEIRVLKAMAVIYIINDLGTLAPDICLLYTSRKGSICS